MWKDLFHFTKEEQKNIFIFFIIIILLIIIRASLPFLIPEENIDFSQFKKEIETFEKGLTQKTQSDYESRLNKYIIARYDTLELFEFDPNTASNEEWKLLGLTDKQLKTINNYLQKGGKYFKPEDFQKMYGIRTKQYEFLEPYIKITPPKKNKKNSTPVKLFEFNPNQLNLQNGLKLGFTKREIKTIEKYRSKAGDFKYKEDFAKMYFLSEAEYKKYEPYLKLPAKTTITKKQNTVKLIKFNPNNLSIETGLKLGFTVKEIKTIEKYRSKAGDFKYKEDFAKMYFLSEAEYEKYEPYITLPQKPEKQEITPEKIELQTTEIEKINLNQCTVSDFQEFKIPEKLSERIIKYRKLLGGYYSHNQLSEVYGLTTEQINIIKKHTFIELKNIQQIDINKITFNRLKYHPYLKKYANQIIKLQKEKTKITTSQLIDILGDDDYQKIKKYLKN